MEAYQCHDYEFVKVKHSRPGRDKYGEIGGTINWWEGMKWGWIFSCFDSDFHEILCIEFKQAE